MLALGAGAVVISGAQSSFYTGRGLTGIVMLVNCAGTLLDISLEYTFIFGAFGFPELGIAGAALTTVISNWATVLMFWLLMRRPAGARSSSAWTTTTSTGESFAGWCGSACPAACRSLIEGGAFTLLTNAVAAVSLVAGAATSLAFTINAVAFVPMIGLNIAVSTLVGQKLGENRPDLAARGDLDGDGAGHALHRLLCGAVSRGSRLVSDAAHGVCRRSDFAAGARRRRSCCGSSRCTASSTPRRSSSSAPSAARATRGSCSSTPRVNLRHLHHHGPIAPAPLAWQETGYGLYGWWWVMTVWLFALGMSYLVRFIQGRWKSIRVIEPELPDEDLPAKTPAAEPAATA